MNFEDKVVLVTGSSRGIGKSIALQFAKEGAKIVVNSCKDVNGGEKVVQEIKSFNGEAIYVQCDVSKEDEVKYMFNKIINTYKKIDILVNNAGIVYDVSFLDKTTEQWRKTLDVNLMGSVFCCKEFGKFSKDKKINGSIINISSRCAIDFYHPDAMDYDISKIGLIMLTKDLAIEFAPNVRVNCVAPGFINTDLTRKIPKEEFAKESKKNYLKRYGNPDEIANAVLFLASDKASFITGEILKVDGGYGGWQE